MKMEPQFFVGRYGLNKELVKQIRSAFRFYEMVRIEVGSPWTDNTAKFAERLELRTGAVVLERAGLKNAVLFRPDISKVCLTGSRFFLYRGFTHADLARKGLLKPSCFNVGNDYAARQWSKALWYEMKGNRDAWRRKKENQRRIKSTMLLAKSSERSRAKNHPLSNQQTRQMSHYVLDHSKNREILRSCIQAADDVSEDESPSDSEEEDQEIEQLISDESDDDEVDEILNSTRPETDSRIIDVDGASERILNDDSDSQREKEVQELAARIQYNIARLKGSPQTDLPLHTELPPM